MVAEATDRQAIRFCLAGPRLSADKACTCAVLGMAKVQAMKERNDRVNGEFYVGPVYNYLEPSNGKIRNFDMGPVGNVMHGLGVPEDYERFILTKTSMVAASKASKLFQVNLKDG